MKIKILLGIFMLVGVTSYAQKAWLEVVGGGDFAPNKEVKLYIDIKACDCQKLLGTTDPIYMWTWNPGDNAARPAGLKNGAWDASNPNLEMTNEGNDVWSYKMVPIDFYNVPAEQVYENDFSFLAKSLDGGSGGGCNEDKTEDVQITVEPPLNVLPKVYSFPFPVSLDTLYTTDNDVFTLIYNNAEEAKASMQNLDEAWVYARAIGTDGVEYEITALNQVGNNSKLKMTKVGNARFQWSIIPRRFFTDLPQGVTIQMLKLQIVKWPLSGTSTQVDGEFTFRFRCN